MWVIYMTKPLDNGLTRKDVNEVSVEEFSSTVPSNKMEKLHVRENMSVINAEILSFIL